jgi:uncharacterized membrane protein YqaE (UPF0057 family)
LITYKTFVHCLFLPICHVPFTILLLPLRTHSASGMKNTDFLVCILLHICFSVPTHLHCVVVMCLKSATIMTLTNEQILNMLWSLLMTCVVGCSNCSEYPFLIIVTVNFPLLVRNCDHHQVCLTMFLSIVGAQILFFCLSHLCWLVTLAPYTL